MSDRSLNIALHRYHHILNQSFDLPDKKLVDIFFILLSNHIQQGKQSDLDLNFLYIYLNKVFFKLANNDQNQKEKLFLTNNEIQVILQNIIQNREAINDDFLIFQILESILIFYKELRYINDDIFYFQLISLIIVKIVFKDFEKDVMPLSSGVTFLSNILIISKKEVLSKRDLHKIAPGIITKLIKVLSNNWKHDTNYLKVALTLLTQTILKCKEEFSKNENILIYQSLDSMINKNWTVNYKSTNTKVDSIILQDFIIPLKDFELVSELLIIEYLYRYESYASELQKQEVFDQYSITNVLCEKIKMIDVLYFDLKTFKIFKNGLMKLSQAMNGEERNYFNKQFNLFVEYGYTKPQKQSFLNQKEVQLPSHISNNTLQNKELSVKFMVNEKVNSFAQIDNQLLDMVLNGEIKSKWLELAEVWQVFFNQKDILEIMNEYSMSSDDELNDKRTYLYYYMFFQMANVTDTTEKQNHTNNDDIIKNLDSINIDDFLTFSDDDEFLTKDLKVQNSPAEVTIQDEDEIMLDQCLQLIDVSPSQIFTISDAYFICGYISSSYTCVKDLQDLETELIPLLLTNIDNPVSQYSLQILSNRIYPNKQLSLSFQNMIKRNTDVILSHVSSIISSSSMSNQRMWIVFTKNVFQVCGIEVVSKADDVFNLMFELMAMKSLNPSDDGYEMTSILELFSVVFDLIIDQYKNLINNESSAKVSRTTLKDVVDLFKNHSYMYDSDEEDDIEEINAVVPAENQEVSLADEPAYTGEIPEHIYKLVIELLGYTERIYPLLSESSVKSYTTLLNNIKKTCLILNTSAKNYLPQLAQVIYPFVEKIVKSGILGTERVGSFVASEKTELVKNLGYSSFNINQILLTNTIEILTLIVKQQPSFMFTRVSELYFDYLHNRITRHEGVDKVLDDFKAELNKFVQSEGGLVVKDTDILKLAR